MTETEVIDAIKYMQEYQTETDKIEAKTAEKGCPQKCYDTISAFANKYGGIIIFGINEHNNFIEQENAIDGRTNEETIIETPRDVNQSLYYTMTKINKDDMLRILGDDGIITIFNQNDEVLAEINKDTQEDEEGNIIVQYNGEETTNIRIVMTKPVQEGIIDINHEKAIKANTGYTKEQIKNFDYLREVVQANDGSAEMNMALLDTTTQYDMTISKTEYSTMNVNKDIDISFILKNNQNNMDLYENPEIAIRFPDEVQNIEIVDQVNILYDSELTVSNAYVEGNTVYILLNGVQTTYKEIGTQINLKLNITLDKKATNRTSEIIATVRNQDESVEKRQEISMISPREMITVNNIEEFGIESYGDGAELTAELERNVEEKSLQITSEVINNKDTTADVQILGEFPTDDSQNNLGSTVITPVQVEGVDATVYYTTNENATEDIGNNENGWVENAENIEGAKKYLISVDKMEPDAAVSFAYNVAVPANLDYNQSATEGYTVYYTDVESKVSNRALATPVVLSTDSGPIVNAELVAKVNGEAINSGDIVKAGEKVNYEINLTNTGTEAATNVQVNLNISEVSSETNNQTLNLNVESIQPNETRTLGYEKEISADLSEEISIRANSTIAYSFDEVDENKSTNEVVLTAKPANIVGEVTWGTNDETELQQGDVVEFIAEITNNTDEVQDNLELEWYLPSNCEIGEQTLIVDGEDGVTYEPLEVTNPLQLRALEPRETVTIMVSVPIGEFEEATLNLSASASIIQGNETYRLGKTEERPVINNIRFFTTLLSANKEGDYVKPGEEIDYTFTITNDNDREAIVVLADQIPAQLTVLGVRTDNNVEEVTIQDNYVEVLNMKIQPHETKTVTIKTVVNYVENVTEDEEIVNKVTVMNTYTDFESNQVTHIIDRSGNIPEEPENPDPEDPDPEQPENPDPEDPDPEQPENPDPEDPDPEQPENPDPENPDPEQPENPDPEDPDPEQPDNPNPEDPDPEQPDNPSQTVKTYKISGTVWLDSSLEGSKDNGENGISGVNVYLINADTNQVVDSTALTNTDGFYTLSNIKNGNYIVIFEYDSTRYGITTYQASGIDSSKNSKALAKQINIFGTEKTYGVTDIITVNGGSIGNINMGLIELDEFDLKIDKYINRVIVKTQSSTKVYSYNDVNMTRVDIDAKELNGAEVTVEYAIKITNVGQVAGYARKIVDYIPEGFTFNSTENKDWYSESNSLYSVILANDKIEAGDSKIINLTLTKEMTEDTTGTYTNRVGIEESYNELNLADRNSQNGTDSASAQLIISIRTGSVALYTILILSIILIVGVGTYFIKIKVLDVNKEERR